MKKKILVISDDIRSISGVGKITRNIINNLAHKYDFVCFAGMINHPEAGQRIDISDEVNKQLNITNASVVIYPQSGYGDITSIRRVISDEKPDALFLVSDPRHFVENIWMHEYEIRTHIPIYYYNLWDGATTPAYNYPFYKSCDFLGCINKQTLEHVSRIVPDKPRSYVPHGIDSTLYKPVQVPQDFKDRVAPGSPEFAILYVSRNIRRKHPTNIMLAADKFAAAIGKPCRLIMNTDIIDQNGTNLDTIITDFDIKVPISFTNGLNDAELNYLYNIADVTVNASEAEGWGLGATESVMAGTPIIATATGGLLDQLYDENGNLHPWAIAMKPTRGLEGSLLTPYVDVDKVSIEQITEALFEAYDNRATGKQRGLEGRNYLMRPEVGMEIKHLAARVDADLTQMIATYKAPKRFDIYTKPDAVAKTSFVFSEEYQKKYDERKEKYNA